MAAIAAIAKPSAVAPHAAPTPLIEALTARYGDALAAIVYYGSCLRAGDPYAGLVDFYVVVDGLRAAGLSRLASAAARVVPPNVYYLEAPGAAGVLRCKYALITVDQLERGARAWFSSAIWGRFAQPLALVYARDADARRAVRRCCGASVVTLLGQALPALGSQAAAPADWFAQALALSFATELRVEARDRARALVAAQQSEYARRFARARPRLSLRLVDLADGRCRLEVDERHARRARRAWRIRRLQGRALSVLRLAKACFTFAGAIDYGAWKVARHTGIEVAVTARMRRHPIIFGAPALVRVLRARRRG